MRIVGTLPHENDTRRLAHYLTKQGIASSCEVSFDPASGQMSYQLWIHEEDQMGQAAAIFEEFQKNPREKKFDLPIADPPLARKAPAPHRFHTHFTSCILGLCAFLFFLNTLQEINARKEGEKELTPLQTLLMYDLPPEQGPYWHGAYDWVVHRLKGESTASEEGPMFIQIRQGEVWRLITPVFLHQGLLHILFNMLWLWYLGRPIEQRIGPLRTGILSFIAGVGSNMAQYLMSGPFFIGYSGIITALAGFIWMRERIAPWEGYPLNKATILFLLFFVGAIFALQVVAFCLQVFSHYNFAPNIANTAHIAGAFIGAGLARFRFFAQRVKP